MHGQKSLRWDYRRVECERNSTVDFHSPNHQGELRCLRDRDGRADVNSSVLEKMANFQGLFRANASERWFSVSEVSDAKKITVGYFTNQLACSVVASHDHNLQLHEASNFAFVDKAVLQKLWAAKKMSPPPPPANSDGSNAGIPKAPGKLQEKISLKTAGAGVNTVSGFSTKLCSP